MVLELNEIMWVNGFAHSRCSVNASFSHSSMKTMWSLERIPPLSEPPFSCLMTILDSWRDALRIKWCITALTRSRCLVSICWKNKITIALVHSLIHSFIHQIFPVYLLCNGHYASYWEYGGATGETQVLWAYSLSGDIKNKEHNECQVFST